MYNSLCEKILYLSEKFTMTSHKIEKAKMFYFQAMYFLEAASLVSRESKKKECENPNHYKLFEGVIVGTHHAFASELLLKGIMLFNNEDYQREHNLYELLNKSSMKNLKEKIENDFNDLPADTIFSEAYQGFNSEKALGSFDYVLEFHANHFMAMRYACEKMPTGLDMNFTSFFCKQLNTELKNSLEI